MIGGSFMGNILKRVSWRENENAIEIGFEFYLDLLEKRIEDENISIVQELRNFFDKELNIQLRATQARGLMHKEASAFIRYVKGVIGEDFNPSSEYWNTQGIETFKEWRRKWTLLRKQEAVDLHDELMSKTDRQDKDKTIMRKTITVNRIVRDNALSRFLKSLYESRCQICTYTFRVPGGKRYAETHHICPLGNPHNGPDKEDNMLVLCPLHHAMFDYGVIALHPEKFTLLSIDDTISGIGKPLLLSKHKILKGSIEYHLERIYGKVGID